MKKLLVIIICLGMLCVSYAHAGLPKDRPEFLSDENMLTYETVILYSIISNMDFLASTKPVDI